MKNILTAISSYPWAILPDDLKNLITIAMRQNDIDAVRKEVGTPLNNSRKTEIRNGVAIIPVTGPIFRYANLFTELSGATSVQMLALDLNQALKDSEVKAIVLDIDSPGGQANGINEFASMMADARGQKPIKAYIGGTGASAAYWIASATDEIIASDTAIIGSIGAMLSIKDRSEADAKDGVKTINIVSSISPYKNTDPATEEGKSTLQTLVDTLGTLFVEAVARHRGISAEAVIKNYGQGGLFVGNEALEAGLIDRLGSLEGVISSLTASGNGRRGGGMSARQRELEMLNLK